jgi:hypothetical protein
LRSRLVSGGFYFYESNYESIDADESGIRLTEVFNTFVENAVEKRQSTAVSDSPRDALTLCTAGSADFW